MNIDGTLFRPSVTLGLTQLLDGTRPEVSAQFGASPSSASDFSTQGKFDKQYFDLALDLEVLSKDNMVISAGAFGSFSETTRQVGASLKLSIPF